MIPLFKLTQRYQDPDALTFIRAVVAAGGLVTPIIKEAVNVLIQGLKTDGTWTPAEMILPVIGGVAASHAINAKNPGTFNLTFNGGWTHASTGMTPNGTTGYADTGYNAATQHSNGLMSIGIYSRTNPGSGTINDMGASNGAFTQQTSIWTRFGDTFYGLAACSGIVSHIPNVDSRGWFFASRTAAAVNFLQKNSTQTSFTETTGTPSLNIYVGAYNLAGTATSFSNKEFAFAWLGGTITTTQASNIYTRIQTFQTSLGRQV